MDVLTRALAETQYAFDGVAAGYEESNAANAVLCAMRSRVRRVVESYVEPGAHILDLGCGPGTDVIHLAANGHRVTAVDWSAAMVEETRRRAGAAGVADRVDVRHVGIDELYRLDVGHDARLTFDAATSNFGPLNCVADLPAAAHRIADRLRPGGVLVASVIGRVCPWELALFLGRGELSRAFIRFRRGLVPVPLDGRTVWMRYLSAGEVETAFAGAGMSRVQLRALGLFVPPPYLHAFAARHTAIVSVLQRLEDGCSGWPVLRGWGDHFLIVLRKAL